jgi:hypothetical protein
MKLGSFPRIRNWVPNCRHTDLDTVNVKLVAG